MSVNNRVRSILVTSGDDSVLGSGSLIDALSPGQIGVFDAQTKVALDGTEGPRNFFLAVGVDKTGSGTLEDIVTSAGQHIETKNVYGYNYREHSAAQPQITVIGGYNGDCETDYAVKLEFRNQQIYRTQGYNQFTKTYAFRTDCCDECDGCPTGDANEVTLKLLEAIAADGDGLITGVPLARQAVTILDQGTSVDYAEGDEMSIADVEALKVFNDAQPDETTKVFSDVQITTVPLAVKQYCSVNLQYFNPRGTVVITSLVDGFSCSGTVEVTQDAAFEEGAGYDIAQKEWHASGNTQNQPYIASDVTGVPTAVDIYADKSLKYDQFNLEYDLSSKAGWGEYLNNLGTTIAIPNSDTITIASLAAVLDGILGASGFDALADDSAAADSDSDAVSPTTDIDDQDADGIA